MARFSMRKSIWVFLLIAIHGTTSVDAQEPHNNQAEPAPIANSEFYGIKTTAQVTRRFEIYDPHSLADLKAVKAMGFDQVILDQPQLHVDATALGLDVVLANWWTKDSSQEAIDDAFRLAKEVEQKRLVGISVMDEPERNSPETPFQFYVDLYKQLKPRLVEGLSQVRLEISYWGPLRGWDQRYYDYFSFLYESADVMRIMPYPDLQEGPLSEVYLMLQRSKRAMRIAGVELPHVVILQTWVLPPENKLPTIDELRVMAYQAMLGGAETLSFFEYKPELWSKTPGFTEGFRELMRELRELRSRFSSADIESTLLENGVLEATARWPSGRLERIRVNTNRFDQDGLKGLEIQDSSLTPLPLASTRPSEQLKGRLPQTVNLFDAACIPFIPSPTRAICPGSPAIGNYCLSSSVHPSYCRCWTYCCRTTPSARHSRKLFPQSRR